MIIKNKKILLAHSNTGSFLNHWHLKRQTVANELGYQFETFAMAEYYGYTIFPYLDKLYKKKDYKLLKFYELLGSKIENCDIFIHYNGALIHPRFLEQFKSKIKVYHCADDPEASNVLSKPVAPNYDICAISNPSCIEMYQKWGCKNVFFWPLGAHHFNDNFNFENTNRDLSLVFIGSKYGVPKYRYVNKIPIIKNFDFISYKTSFLNKFKNEFPFMTCYGGGWDTGHIDDSLIPNIYQRSLLGLNLHNGLGPINARLFDLASFGVCQICDNKFNLHQVFDLGKEIIGFDSFKEAVELTNYYLNHIREAEEIGNAAKRKFNEKYTTRQIMNTFFLELQKIINENIINKNIY
jgi:hypothetical protein